MDEIAKLGERLAGFYKRFGRHFHTKTRATSEYGLKYISGLLRMEYYGDIPANTRVYLEKPLITHPLTKRDKPSKTPQVIGTAYEVRELRKQDWL